MKSAQFLDYIWANFMKSTSKLLKLLLTRVLNKLVFVTSKHFQLSLLFGSKAGAYPSEECPIYQLHLGMDKL